MFMCEAHVSYLIAMMVLAVPPGTQSQVQQAAPDPVESTPQPRYPRYEVGVGGGISQLHTRHFDNLLNESANVALPEIFLDAGVDNATTVYQADARALAGWLELVLRRRLDIDEESRSIYIKMGFGRTSAFNGTVTGSGSAGADLIEANLIATSTLTLVTSSFGWRQGLSSRWSVYGGVGAAWRRDEQTSTSFFATNGVPGPVFENTEIEHDTGILGEAGVIYALPIGTRSRGIDFDLGLTYVDFRQPMLGSRIGLRYTF